MFANGSLVVRVHIAKVEKGRLVEAEDSNTILEVLKLFKMIKKSQRPFSTMEMRTLMLKTSQNHKLFRVRKRLRLRHPQPPVPQQLLKPQDTLNRGPAAENRGYFYHDLYGLIFYITPVQLSLHTPVKASEYTCKA